MKIMSRPEPATVIGSGPYYLEFDIEEAQLLSAYLYATRLGSADVYKRTARGLLDAIEDEFGTAFMEQAVKEVGLTVSRIDPNDTIIDTLEYDEIIIEVK